MTLSLDAQPVPLTADADGVVRISNTRVPLDTLISAFLEGATAEEIVHQYPSVELADVYAVIAYYLRQRPQIEKYLQQRHHQAEQVRQQNETRFAPDGIRARLLARRSSGKTA